MTDQHARTTANIVMAAAALGAAVFVLRNPKWRRTAWLLARQYATGPLAVWTTGTIREAWDASGESVANRHAIVAQQAYPAEGVRPVS
jgi:hypothetical protein